MVIRTLKCNKQFTKLCYTNLIENVLKNLNLGILYKRGKFILQVMLKKIQLSRSDLLIVKKKKPHLMKNNYD